MITKFKQYNESLRDLNEGFGVKDLRIKISKEKDEDYILNHISDPNIQLNKSCERNYLVGIQKALENGADINNNSWEIQPIEISIINGAKYDIIKYLLDNGADIKSWDENHLKLLLFHNPVFYKTKELLLNNYNENNFKKSLKRFK